MAKILSVGFTLATAAVLVTVLAGGGSAAGQQTGLAAVHIEGVPHVQQKPDFCGEACAAMWLGKLGKTADQDWVFDQGGMDPALGTGLRTAEMARALAAIGFKVGPVWHKVEARDQPAADAGVERLFRQLHDDLAAGVPSIVCMHYDDKPATTEHFRLVTGYDPKADEVIYHEPAIARGGDQRMKRSLFLKLWPLRYDKDNPLHGLVIRLRLEGKAEALKDAAPAQTPTAADLAQQVMKVKEKLPRGFALVISPPFVVVGDEPGEVLRRRAQATVAWAVKRLRASFFEQELPEAMEIWLFKDKESYEKHTREIFEDEPGTPYGYYSAEHNALIMNIATGGGTLVHEIVHPYMRANFPKCPAWFNEGMGSLYEQSAERAGQIVGLTNWRLAGLQRAIKVGRVPSFKDLTATSTRQFYHEDPGTNYAQARYLCYYLQEKGLLPKFYQDFLAGHKDDPTGYATLQKTLGEADMTAFQARWQEWVAKLTFP